MEAGSIAVKGTTGAHPEGERWVPPKMLDIIRHKVKVQVIGQNRSPWPDWSV